MSSTGLCKTPSVDYFSLVTQRPQNITANSPYRGFLDDIDSSHSPNDILSSATESDSTFLTTPTSPASSSFPHPTYHLPPTPSTEKTASARQARALTGTLTSALDNFGTVEDWMCWDDSLSDPCDKALSPTSEYFPELKLEPVSPVMSSINPRTISNGSDEPLFPTESLYSTPLSWSRPTPGPADCDIRRPQPQMFSALSPSEESKLRSIAMPAQTQYPASPSSASSPEQMDNRRKRKSSIDDDDEDMEEDSGRPMRSGGRQQPIKKTAHNMIEKRYRTNLNDKIAALRDSVPSLRVMVKKNSRGEDIEEDLQGLTPAHKLNKATVLAKATEYIAHLEKRNKHICKENAQLKARIEAFEILVMSQSQSPQQQNQVQQQQQHRQQQHQQPHNSAYRQNSTSNNAHMEWLG